MLSGFNCSIHDENKFGPQVAATCYEGFDFTLLFEEVTLSTVPIAIIFPLVLARAWQLKHGNEKVHHGAPYVVKMVSWLSDS